MALTQALCGQGSLHDDFLKNLGAARIYFMQEGSLFFDLEADAGTMKFGNLK